MAAEGLTSPPPRTGPAWLRSAVRRVNAWFLLTLPAVVFLGVFFIVPLVGMLTRSLTDPSPHNYAVMIESTLYVQVMWTTMWTAAVVTLACLVIAYPYAYLMHIARPRVRAVLVGIVLVSLWSSLLVRSYAWTVLLQDTGLINDALIGVGLVDEPLPLIRSTLGVVVGMTQILIPFMVFPIFAVMHRIDPSYFAAAVSLGASPLRAFRRVFLPLSFPGVVAGCMLVFVLSIGFYITPELLGSPSNRLFGQLIADQVNERLDFGVASALSVVLIGATALVLLVGSRLVSLRTTFAFEGED